MDSIRAITFDVGGTLLEPWPSVGHVYATVAHRFGLGPFSQDSLTSSFLQSWNAKTAFDYSIDGWRHLVGRTFGESLPSRMVDPVFKAIYEEFSRADAWRVYDDVLPTLCVLRDAGYKLGVLSNWDERLRPLLAELHLSHWFEPIIVSCEAKAVKPSPYIFELAARQLDLEPHQILHVGDGAREDVDGARGAGFAAAYLRRGDQNCQWPSLATLLDLIPVLETNT